MNYPFLEEMNETYCINNRTGELLSIHKDASGQLVINVIDSRKFHMLHANTRCKFKNKDMTYSQAWLQWPGNRRIDEIVFDPSNNHTANQLNLWQGFIIKPSSEGSCALFNKFVLGDICNGNQTHYDFLMDWCADIYQNPSIKKGSAIILQGEQGTGKTLFMDSIGYALGHHYLPFSSVQRLAGNFNSHFEGILLAFMDEASGLRRHSVSSQTKDMITSHKRIIERKGIDAYTVDDYTRYGFATNDLAICNAGKKERRYFVIKTNDEHEGNTEYFEAIVDELDNGGRERLLYDLLNREITSNLRVPPKTQALLEQKKRSLKPAERLWFEAVASGEFNEQEIWGHQIPSSKLADGFINDFPSHTQRSAEMLMGDALRLLCSTCTKVRTTKQGKREWAYNIPSLLDCRLALEEHFGQSIEWPKNLTTQNRVMNELIAKVTQDWEAQPDQLTQLK